MFNPLVIKGGAWALSILAAVFITWKVSSWKNDSGVNKLIDQTNAVNLKNKKLSDDNVALQSQIKALLEKKSDPVKKEIREVPIYRDCVVPDSGVRLINDKAASINQAISAQ